MLGMISLRYVLKVLFLITLAAAFIYSVYHMKPRYLEGTYSINATVPAKDVFGKEVLHERPHHLNTAKVRPTHFN